jgi:hypothetical protein
LYWWGYLGVWKVKPAWDATEGLRGGANGLSGPHSWSDCETGWSLNVEAEVGDNERKLERVSRDSILYAPAREMIDDGVPF